MVDVIEANLINKQNYYVPNRILLHSVLRFRMPDLDSFTFQVDFFCDVVKI